jgi:hypothetical protein
MNAVGTVEEITNRMFDALQTTVTSTVGLRGYD